MFGSFMLGFAGVGFALVGICLGIGALSLALSQNICGAVFTAVIGIAACVAGGYIRYLSQQSVKSSDALQYQTTGKR